MEWTPRAERAGIGPISGRRSGRYNFATLERTNLIKSLLEKKRKRFLFRLSAHHILFLLFFVFRFFFLFSIRFMQVLSSLMLVSIGVDLRGFCCCGGRHADLRFSRLHSVDL